MATENSDDIRLIVKIAQLYYEQDMTQAQIARELGIYRTTISRLLKRGREQGIVTIAINYDYNENLWLEQQLKQKFGLKEAVVVSCDSEQEDEQLTMMGVHGAQLLERLLEPGGHYRVLMGPRGAGTGGRVIPCQPVAPADLRADYRRTVRQVLKAVTTSIR